MISRMSDSMEKQTQIRIVDSRPFQFVSPRCFLKTTPFAYTSNSFSGVLHILLHMAELEEPVTSEDLSKMMDTNPVVVRRLDGRAA